MPLQYWTKERIFDAFSEWESEHGSLPNSTDWAKTVEGVHPTNRTVYKMFGSWPNALAEYQQPKKRWKIWSEEEIVEALLRWTEEEGHPPRYKDVSRGDHGGRLPSLTSLISRFGGFRKAMHAAGLEPLPHGVTYRSIQKYRPLPRRSER